MTGVYLATAIALTVVGALLLWSAAVRVQTRVSPAQAPHPAWGGVPVGLTTRVCNSSTCAGPMPHVVMPCGAAMCIRCGIENAAPADLLGRALTTDSGPAEHQHRRTT